VDLSARVLVGSQLEAGELALLEKLARSRSLWERRIATIATFAHIRQGELEPAFRIAEMLLGDEHDLIHKAVGWMLRETGKQSSTELARFLKRHYKRMPRTALRYAIERFPEERRREMLQGRF
jgi:3-methyladenine DNA glycosylase AlkD